MYDDRIVLLDADVIIHFVRAWQLDVLPTIYNSEYWIIDRVFDEVYGILGRSRELNSLARDHGNVYKKDLPMELDVIEAYSQLENRFGKGESAIMAMGKAYDEVVASSNIRDVEDYCNNNGIDWITTLDMLADAYARGIYTANNCNEFIQQARNKGSKLPNVTIHEYINDNH